MPDVWLGVPQGGDACEDVLDPYTSKIGGKAVHFCVAKRSESSCFACPRCRSSAHVSLVAQLYAPLAHYDRFIYILLCAACTARAKVPGAAGEAGVGAASTVMSSCFAVRGQNFNPDYFAEAIEQRKSAAAMESERGVARACPRGDLLFDETDDWGMNSNDADEAQVQDALVDSAAHGVVPERVGQTEATAFDGGAGAAELKEEEAHRVCARGVLIDVGGTNFTGGIALDLFIEPVEVTKTKKAKDESEEALRALERRYGGSLEVNATSVETDTEGPAARRVREYLECIERNPTQCIRWCPDGEPLRSSVQDIVVPSCAACGAVRRYELQVVAPAVYFLTRADGESDNKLLHFSNILVYTCSLNCYRANRPYVREFVAVESEM